ncbi:6-phosphogluconate dehydrogenase C-terminal domain-like protein [Punctularia strigosozonata HHB-11173 SS5]|uniref:6-phosphogluconate dehydrogenase C-terminal domain-like protein n=1 Tax=Punctularia strigosozonata (strain HHB-11173) TaxID=741275 RepID=UPI0004418620|nr:6-phosphogluconate dehydrogenase C-terminal domain-like protein [Punctularia strigosozonata HHB-11173 SS5]EIN10979.1 6-phosphogluconate dehydrogenase C-terminal domain-like protein [Punctularia strigosozonata HHB-11173 SS5]
MSHTSSAVRFLEETREPSDGKAELLAIGAMTLWGLLTLGKGTAFVAWTAIYPQTTVKTPQGAAEREYAFVLCCFKALPDVLSTPALLGPLLTRTRTFVLVQNGVGIHDDLQRVVPGATIITACAWIDATLVANGTKLHQTGPEKLSFGFHPPSTGIFTQRVAGIDLDHPNASAANFSRADAQGAVDLFASLLRAGGADPDPTNDINFQRWRKVLWNACFSTLCTMSRGSMADIMSSSVEAYRTTIPAVREIMREVISVAYAYGGVRPGSLDAAPDAIIADAIQQYADFDLLRPSAGKVREAPSSFRPSMLVDLEAGRPIEVEVIVGNVLRAVARGSAGETNAELRPEAELGNATAGVVSTPRLELIYGTLKVIQSKLLQGRAL